MSKPQPRSVSRDEFNRLLKAHNNLVHVLGSRIQDLHERVAELESEREVVQP